MDRNHDAFRDLGLEMRRSKSTEPRLGLLSPLPPSVPGYSHTPGVHEMAWRRLLRVPWAARRSNQSIPKEISPEYSLEGLRLKLKLQYIGHLMQRACSLEKTLMLGKVKGRRRGERERMRWLDGITD